jgi:hypothetical protein
MEAEEDRAGCRDGPGEERRQKQASVAERNAEVMGKERERGPEGRGPDADAEDETQAAK